MELSFLARFVFPELETDTGVTGYTFSPSVDERNYDHDWLYVSPTGPRSINQMQLSGINDPWNVYPRARVTPYAKFYKILQDCYKNNISFLTDVVLCDDKFVQDRGGRMSWNVITPDRILATIIRKLENVITWDSMQMHVIDIQKNYNSLANIGENHINSIVARISQRYTMQIKNNIGFLKLVQQSFGYYTSSTVTPENLGHFLPSFRKQNPEFTMLDIYKKLQELENSCPFTDFWHESQPVLELEQFGIISSFPVNGENIYQYFTDSSEKAKSYATLHHIIDLNLDLEYLRTMVVGMIRPGNFVLNKDSVSEEKKYAIVVALNGLTASLQFDTEDGLVSDVPAFMLGPASSMTETATLNAKPGDFNFSEQPRLTFQQHFKMIHDGTEHIVYARKIVDGYVFYGCLQSHGDIIGTHDNRWIPALWVEPVAEIILPPEIETQVDIQKSDVDRFGFAAVPTTIVALTVLALVFVADSMDIS